MCGICGIKRFGEAPIDQSSIDLLILNNQNRGLEAAGVALQQADGSVQVYKEDVTPYQFISGPGYKKFMKENLKKNTLIAIGHTRKATKGSPVLTKNNHPMFAGQTAVVHNGVINNDDSLFNEWHLERKAETDSDIFRALLDDKGFTPEAINKLSRCTGNAAFAAISPKFPGKLLLARSGNPIELMATTDFLMFSSEKGPLYKAIRPYEVVYGITMRNMTPTNYWMIGMEDHSAWLIGDKPLDGVNNAAGDWLEWHQQMHISYNFQPRIYKCNADYHGTRTKFYDDRPVEAVMCPNCNLYIAVPPSRLSDLKLIKCGVCKTHLA